MKDKFSSSMDNIKAQAKKTVDTAQANFEEKTKTGRAIKDIRAIKNAETSEEKKRLAKEAAKTRLKNSVFGKAGLAMKQETVKIAAWVVQHKTAIIVSAASIAAALAIFNIACLWIGVSYSLKSSPHYYCDIEVEPEIKKSTLYKQYCLTSNSADHDSIAKAAIQLSTTDLTLGGRAIIFDQYPQIESLKAFLNDDKYTVGTFIDVAPKLTQRLYEKTDGFTHCTSPSGTEQQWINPASSSCYYASCDFNVCLAVLWSGADDDFPTYLGGAWQSFGSGHSAICGYLRNNPNGRWIELTRGEDVLPGDVAIGLNSNNIYGHVWMYVGTWENGSWTDNSLVQEKYPGSSAVRYEGSHRDFYPRVCGARNPWDEATKIFRYVGVPDEESIFIDIVDESGA